MSFKARTGKKRASQISGRKLLLLAFLILTVAGTFVAYEVFGPNTGVTRQDYLYIPTGSGYTGVKALLKNGGFVRNMRSFDFLAKRSGYDNAVKAGRYRISRGMSNYSIIRMLRAGRQTPVKLVINKLRTRQDFIRLISTHLEADSNALNSLMNDSAYLSAFGLDSNTSMCAVLPDTYEFWWNTSADKTYKKIAGYYLKYWDEQRKGKAREKEMTPQQIITLASIVDEETNYAPEKPDIASVYLNRLSRGMLLQADPTVKFALGDFSIRRITSMHTSVVSPYNTYKVTGLPPGPICTPSKTSIEAVLNAHKTNYLYFCARETLDGRHRFSGSYSEHLINAGLYQKALNDRGIK